MSRLRAHCFAISLDGYGAGPDQSLEHPLGVGGHQLHEWAVATTSWRRSHGLEGGETDGLDDAFIARSLQGVGATIMGRHMYEPPDAPASWTGWWGDDPPFHHPVFVLTHRPRPPLAVGDTTFHFVSDGITAALSAATDAAGGLDVRLGGGASTIRQYLRAGLVDELHLAVVPVLLGGGERLFQDLPMTDYTCVEHVASPAATHVRLARRGQGTTPGRG